ncbi:hypothetical protein F5148DRAFT_979510 [Russula earlei]|uniref:Uncharacterized protein n=1 Tax=Russula earlei TaxID=71964 RepID=A0ACC0UAZ5_9AGAM|nr:hypothetical protein F5148DRAFT_979510 [Russula earlei]
MSQGSTPVSNSPLSRSFLDASTAIDDLTRSLVDYSRVSTPDPPLHLPECECNTEDSEYTKAWLAVKAKLESRLVLSAEVGQALLQRHEAYVRRLVQATKHASNRPKPDDDPPDPEISPATRKQMEDRIAELSRENAVLEKRFSQALLNNELAEVSNKTLSADLQESRVAFNRLSTEHARSVGWEERLRDALQERDDFHQERDSEAQKLRTTEARLASLSDKCAKLDLEVRVLEEQLEEERKKHIQMSEEIMREAKQWLAGLQHSRVDLTSIEHHDEIMKLLESLVAEKEALRKSNVELHELLSESREALQTLQEERLASPDDGRMLSPPSIRPHDIPMPSASLVCGTAPSPLSPISSIFSLHDQSVIVKRPLNLESPSHRSFEPLTPETSQPPLSSGSPQPRHIRRRREPNSDIDVEIESWSTTNESDDDATPGKPKREKSKSLYSLQRHRAVQTDSRDWNETLSPTGYGDQLSLPLSSNEGESESSSLADNPSTLGILLEHVHQLFNKITQADARTLTTRLKRQNILGADISYLSHSTVDGIIAEVANLRTIFRAALEDDKFTTICTRRDMRNLLKFLKDIFKELGTLRTTLNDVVLDPSIAPRVREMTMNPMVQSPSGEKAPSSSSGSGWMAPLSKLFSSTTLSDSKRGASPHGVNQGRGPTWLPPRIVPKLGPATSASTTTVNVEFTGTSAGRAVTKMSPIAQEAAQGPTAPVTTRSTSVNLMGIFAGAPRNDPWIVLPQGVSQSQGEKGDRLRRTTLGRAAGRAMAESPTQSFLPRNVDAVIDPRASSEERGGIDPARSLRTRGLSDSSIRSTFLQHAEAASVTLSPNPPEADGGRTVLGAFGQTVHGVRSIANPRGTTSPPSSSQLSPSRAASPRLGRLMPNISSWATTSRTLDSPDPDAYVGSLISNAPLRPLDRGEL